MKGVFMKMTITKEKLQEQIDYINEWFYSLQDCKEQLVIEKEKLEKILGGIKDINKLPGLIFIVDPKKEAIALNEADRLDIPVVALIDTNSDPDLIDYPIPGNDDAFKSINLITRTIADAALEGIKRQEIAQMEDEAINEKKEENEE